MLKNDSREVEGRQYKIETKAYRPLSSVTGDPQRLAGEHDVQCNGSIFTILIFTLMEN